MRERGGSVLTALDFLKFFCQKYSDNQKWAVHYYAAPLITLLREELPPEGKPLKETDNFC